MSLVFLFIAILGSLIVLNGLTEWRVRRMARGTYRHRELRRRYEQDRRRR